jgi:cytochrome c-type biogenesis protein CcmE
MSTKSIKIGVTGSVLLAALMGLMYTTVDEEIQYYKHVDEVMADANAWQGKRLKLHGFVVENSVLKKPDTLQYRFQVHNNGKVISASYTGVVPDNFKGGAEVVLNGRLGPDGFVVERDGVVGKCPSKYEASRTPGVPKT